MEKSKLGTIVSRLIVLLLVLALVGCAAPAPAGGSVPQQAQSAGLPKMDPAKAWSMFESYITKGKTEYEVPLNQAWNDMMNQAQLLYNNVPNMTNLVGLCFSNEAAAQAAIANAVFSGGSTPSAANVDSMMNILASGSGFTGEQATKECATQYRDVAQYLVTHSEALVNAQQKVFNLANAYRLFLQQNPQTQILNDLMNTYADPAQLEQALADRGISSTSVEWLPSSLLMIQIGDKPGCDFFTSGAFADELLPDSVRRLYVNHPQSMEEMYQAKWSKTLGMCTFYRGAALNYVLMPKISTQATNGILGGNGVIVPTPQPIPGTNNPSNSDK